MFHNTTIIAIILALAAMLGTSLEDRQQEAYDEEQAVQDRRETVQDDRQTLENDIADLELEYASVNEDSAKLGESTSTSTTDGNNEGAGPANYQARVKELKERDDSLSKEEAVLTEDEKKHEKNLAVLKKKNQQSGLADVIFQMAVLFSSIGVSIKKHNLKILAFLLTAVGLAIELMVFLL